tara:strand:- start:1049 stop:2728 length:1680 start_codon:yes stop_codon:yes gene_type:complete
VKVDFSEVNRALFEHGFTNQRNKKGISVYSGFLHVASKEENVKATIIFLDRDMKKPPYIRLDSMPDWVPIVCPHISHDGLLCYLDSQRAYLPRWEFPGAVISCIHAAEAMLDKIARGEIERDIEDEFLAYWAGKPLLIDLPDFSKRRNFDDLGFFDIELDEQRSIQLIGVSPSYLASAYEDFVKPDRIHSTPLHFVEIDSPLGASGDNWPPKTVYDLLEWSKKISPSIQDCVRNALCDISDPSKPQSLVLIKGTNKSCAVAIKGNIDFFLYKKYRSPEQFAQRVTRFQKLQKRFELIRFEPTPTDPESWLTRNNQDKHLGLSGKRVILLGCGSVGGYLADILAKMGAGQLGGELILSDDDSLQPGNLGRHILGFADIGGKKSLGMRNRLRSMYPHIEVNVSTDAEIKDRSTHLVIDATGSKEVSHYINELKVEGEISADVIFTWVAGEGIGAQAILVSDLNYACLTCLETDRPGGIHSVLKNGYETGFKEGSGGCGDFLVPFDVTAAIHAASLAGKMVLDWSRNRPHPTLRTILLDRKNGAAVTDASPKPNRQCPICAN